MARSSERYRHPSREGKQSIAAGSPAKIDVTENGSTAEDDVLNSASQPIKDLKFTTEELIALREYNDGQTLWRIPDPPYDAVGL